MGTKEDYDQIETLCGRLKAKWAIRLNELNTLKGKIPLTYLEKIGSTNELFLVNRYLSQAEICYIFLAPLGSIALCASAVEYFLKVLLPKDYKNLNGKHISRFTLGDLIGAAEKEGLLTNNSLRKARNLNKLFRIPYVHSKPEETPEGREEIAEILGWSSEKDSRSSKSQVTKSLLTRGMSTIHSREDAKKVLRDTRIILRDLIEYRQTRYSCELRTGRRKIPGSSYVSHRFLL